MFNLLYFYVVTKFIYIMEKEKKQFWRSELILGSILAFVFTVAGTFLGVRLQQGYETKKNDRELGMKICEIINARYYLSRNIALNSNDLSEERWNVYMANGVIPYNINKEMIMKYIEAKHGDLTEEFKKIDSIFIYEIHVTLISIKKMQEKDQDKKDYKQKEEKAHNEIDKIQNEIKLINKKLYDF